MNVLIAGEDRTSQELARALAALGIDASVASGEKTESAPALVSLARTLEAERPAVAVAVGAGTAALALAITSTKLSIPTAALPLASSGREAEQRIVSTLADLAIGSGSDHEETSEAAAELAASPYLD